ncbi:Squalene/phytoene synthase [uncultured archaeon]|nr:Squalene/phytoene synthase [uncultured archaeon]
METTLTLAHKPYEGNLTNAYQYCRNVAQARGPNFSLGFSFLPAQKRDAVYAVYAFSRYADDIVDEKHDMNVSTRLDLWEDALHRLYEGEFDHPVTAAMADAVKGYHIPKKPFLDLIEGCRMDLRKNRYSDFSDLYTYCEKVASTISVMSLCIFGYKSEDAFHYGESLSTALQLTNIIRDVGEDAERNRIYLPQDELKKFGLTDADILNKTYDERFIRLMDYQTKRALSYFKDANNLIPLINDDSAYCVALMGSVYVGVLKQIEKNRFNVYSKKARISPARKALLVARKTVNPLFI